MKLKCLHPRYFNLSRITGYFQIVSLIILSSSWCHEVACSSLPVVIWHGMGDHGKSGGIQTIIKAIQQTIPGTYVRSIMTHDSIARDVEDTYFMPINEQISLVCKMVTEDPELSEGFHAIGISQGGLFVRALVQRCPIKQIGSIISIGGPQQGVFGLPNCPVGPYRYFCEFIRRILSKGAYEDFIQKHLVQAQYWHDPLKEDIYRNKSLFLADINQENHINVTYRENMLKMKHLILISFLNDTVVYPEDTELFGFYEAGTTDRLHDLRQSELYQKDKLGLKLLDETGRLHFLSTEGNHLQFSLSWFIQEVIEPYLK